MTFKEQMQEKAETYISENAGILSQQLVIQDTWDKCSQAALSSDLVKGLVEYNERLINIITEYDIVGLVRDVDNEVGDDLLAYTTDSRAALTNYKQEVKQ